MKILPSFKLLSLFGLVCLGASLCESAAAADAGVRIRFGLTDNEPQKWDGTVTVKPGRVTAISGWRFAQDDHANGTEGWAASTRPPNVANRTNAQKGKAKAADAPAKAKKGGAAAKAKNKAKAAAAAALGAMADNGVLLMLTDVNENSSVTVKTERGELTFALASIPY